MSLLAILRGTAILSAPLESDFSAMADLIVPSKTVTFTIKKTPVRPADRQTIQRLMRMQRPIQNALEKLSRVRRQERNHRRQRAGRMWMGRYPMTRGTHVLKG